jgi:UDP-N-acetylglucosamine 2-epimerase (non-hydrolysing)/UDP-GlcNAc3NAcA epimerase
MRILTVIGNRPQFIKAAAVTPALRRVHDEVMVHTGQHFDEELSAVFFAELGLPAPERELGIALGSNISQTARMLAALEPVLEEVAPDAVLVYGDTNSTLAGALAGAQAAVPVAHVEAGMRSFDRRMPEEVNRILADHVSDLLLCSSEMAAQNLRNEGITEAVEVVGDVMVDVALKVQPRARERSDLLERWALKRGEYVLATAHRPSNVDHLGRLQMLVDLLTSLPIEVIWPLHPRTRQRLERGGLLEQLQTVQGVILTPPLGYLEVSALLCNARAVMTDSGGLQKEAYLAGVPCVTLRRTTEWGETVQHGWNTVVDLERDRALEAVRRDPPPDRPPLYGDGRAGERVVSALTLRHQ